MKINHLNFNYYTFHPLSKDLNINQKIFFCFCCAILSLITIGMAPIFYYSTLQYKIKKIEDDLSLRDFQTLKTIQVINQDLIISEAIKIENWSNKVASMLKQEFLTKLDKELFKNLMLEGSSNKWINKESRYLGFQENFLHQLAKHGENLDFVDILAEVGEDFNHKENVFGNTPLLWAIANANYQMAEKILSVGSNYNLNLNLKSSLKQTISLSLLIKKGKRHHIEEIFMTLLYSLIDKSNINSQDEDGNTPLHIACRRRDWDIVRLLLENKADKEIVNKDKQKPIDMINGNFEQVLKEMGGQDVSLLHRNLFAKKTPRWVYEKLTIINEA